MLKCPNCPRKFQNIANLGSHMRKEHPHSVSGSIRNGLKKSPKTPQARADRLTKAIRDVSAAIAGLAPAVVLRDPTLAVGAIGPVIKAVESVRDLVEAS